MAVGWQRTARWHSVAYPGLAANHMRFLCAAVPQYSQSEGINRIGGLLAFRPDRAFGARDSASEHWHHSQWHPGLRLWLHDVCRLLDGHMAGFTTSA